MFDLEKDITINELEKVGFIKKYDEDTGEIKEYRKYITEDEKYYFFICFDKHNRFIFRKLSWNFDIETIEYKGISDIFSIFAKNIYDFTKLKFIKKIGEK